MTEQAPKRIVLVGVIAIVLVGPVWTCLRDIARSLDHLEEIARNERIDNHQLRVQVALKEQQDRSWVSSWFREREAGQAREEQRDDPGTTGAG